MLGGRRVSNPECPSPGAYEAPPVLAMRQAGGVSLPFRGYDGTRLTALGAFTTVSQRRASFEIRSQRRSWGVHSVAVRVYDRKRLVWVLSACVGSFQ
jgi:hypothetical protein